MFEKYRAKMMNNAQRLYVTLKMVPLNKIEMHDLTIKLMWLYKWDANTRIKNNISIRITAYLYCVGEVFMPRSPEPKSQVRLQWHCCHQLAHVTLTCPRMIFQPFTCLAKCSTIQSIVQYNNTIIKWYVVESSEVLSVEFNYLQGVLMWCCMSIMPWILHNFGDSNPVFIKLTL